MSLVDLNGKPATNERVAEIYLDVFKAGSTTVTKIDAQVFAVARATYVTSTQLVGGPIAASYGFSVSTYGTGVLSINVGSNGAAFGVANNTTRPVSYLLSVANAKRTPGGVWYGGDQALMSAANEVFTLVNEVGDRR